jgi:phosphatidate phosphatase APP1
VFIVKTTNPFRRNPVAMLRLTSALMLKQKDSATVFPSLGHLSHNGNQWRAVVSGLIFQEAVMSLGKKFMLGLLRRAMRVERAAFETELFRQRIAGFLVNTRKIKKLAVKIDESTIPLVKPCFSNGLFHEEVVLPTSITNHAESIEKPHFHAVSVIDANGETVGRTGSILCLPRRGISVVSDIDDTLKETLVHCRKSMLANTFLNAFVPIHGIGKVYQTWEAQQASFHYVSSSPWQLYDPLENYIKEQQLPVGSMHLRAFRLRDHMLRRIFLGRKPIKGAVIRGIMQRYPLRKFVLVGDSSEYDPEIYGALARKSPQQVAAIFIRKVPHSKLQKLRFERAFRNLHPSLWSMFEDAAEMPLHLAELVS